MQHTHAMHNHVEVESLLALVSLMCRIIPDQLNAAAAAAADDDDDDHAL